MTSTVTRWFARNSGSQKATPATGVPVCTPSVAQLRERSHRIWGASRAAAVSVKQVRDNNVFVTSSSSEDEADDCSMSDGVSPQPRRRPPVASLIATPPRYLRHQLLSPDGALRKNSVIKEEGGNGRRPLSAQSTLESISGQPRRCGVASSSGGSPASTAAVTCSSQAGAHYGISSDSASPQGLEPVSPGMYSPQQSTAASLGPLFTCVSPYLSTADVRMATPFKRLYDPRGPVQFAQPPLRGMRLHRGELKLWDVESERIISQNSSNRRVHRALWVSNADPRYALQQGKSSVCSPAALKFVEDCNPRDGRSLKREIECHIYVYQKLPCLFQLENELRSSQLGLYSFTRNPEWSIAERLEDAWPSAELFGYHLDKKSPGKSVLLTRKLSGPDLFDVIRAEHNHNWHFHHPSNNTGEASNKCRTIYSHRTPTSTTNRQNAMLKAASTAHDQCAYYPYNYEYHKLRWCALALKRISQYAALSIRHNDVKPDNIVLDFYQTKDNHKCLDVKLIDLGTASMHNATDFTGGTSWYESPEQKLLEYFMKKRKNPDAAKRVEIDLPSDLWGAGISLAEVLVGRRVVDTLKAPHGPGSLEYLGYDAYTQRASGRFASSDGVCAEDAQADGGHLDNYPFWALDPADWIVSARKALGLDREGSITLDAARWIFNHLVRPCPKSRTSLSEAMNRMERFAEEAYKRYRHVTSSFDVRRNGSEDAGMLVPEPPFQEDSPPPAFDKYKFQSSNKGLYQVPGESSSVRRALGGMSYGATNARPELD